MLKILSYCCFFAAGIFIGTNRPSIPVIHAQQSSLTLSCNIVGPCSQYLVQVNSARGFGRFQVFQLASPVDQTQLGVIGGGSAVSLQFYEPMPRDSQSFTLAVSEP